MAVNLAENLLADADGEIIEPGLLFGFFLFKSAGEQLVIEAKVELEFIGRRRLVGGLTEGKTGHQAQQQGIMLEALGAPEKTCDQRVGHLGL